MKLSSSCFLLKKKSLPICMYKSQKFNCLILWMRQHILCLKLRLKVIIINIITIIMNIIIINLTKIHWDWKFLLDISSEEKSVKIFQSGGILSSNTHPLQQQSFSTPSYHGPAYRQPFPGLWPGFHFILHSQLFSSMLLLV